MKYTLSSLGPEGREPYGCYKGDYSNPERSRRFNQGDSVSLFSITLPSTRTVKKTCPISLNPNNEFSN